MSCFKTYRLVKAKFIKKLEFWPTTPLEVTTMKWNLNFDDDDDDDADDDDDW